jgi:uncharacterized protein YecE (DUF72 family)
MADIRIGVSGWRYPPWRGRFYPKGLPQRAELEFLSRKFTAVEINGSFYSLQRPECYARWYEQTPPDFVFAVKGSRYITHMLKLRDCEQALANFLASGILKLADKLGPFLWQFPASFRYDRARMEAFFALLPRDTEQALALARRRARWMKGRTSLALSVHGELRHAVEFRHASCLDTSFVDLLRDNGIAFVVAETAGLWPLVHDVTADFIYMRLHGDKELYRSGYSDAALGRWAKRIAAWHRGDEPESASKISPGYKPAARPRDVYCFFDNTDAKLRAPFDAQTLMRKLDLTVPSDDDGVESGVNGIESGDETIGSRDGALHGRRGPARRSTGRRPVRRAGVAGGSR